MKFNVTTLSISHAALTVVMLSLITLCAPSMAADLFQAGKETIKDTAGDGSAVENAILAAGAIGAVAGGFMSRNWLGAAGGFGGGMIFWEVIKPLVGLA
ncbi:IncF plasmid conjugative transfer pilin protein TraA [Vibrio nigripulchritudo MADA3029]|uniref:type IV conjugative transfer system pilin TraA n=1 Tax=Vibrio nigripulchritudo TaxID=28173 RepID=UPI0003B1F9B8|nr:type IV conjugative transfer system pilin TraA [Vibrio nigripulchritudo]CCN50852.1 IncF plasmid conjugative transfer pilin protein TraA [Vibrio nigripulchritudo MADA3020]CCN56710.1 IncF plasmid conjugative transfer pilin protein TraA [Vibrio nigripulchritudo MADA3021]CCN62567.1 IncF plasmid conjugative transfer pilin protein TraA [Vibrio nigripulchritudo MADA3029]